MKLKILLAVVMVCFVISVGCATVEKIGRSVASNVVDEGKAIVNEEFDKVKDKVAVKKYVVVKNDCLWDISGKQYGDPFLWTAIYKDNRDGIEDPNIIEIDQEIDIRYDHTSNEWAKARNEAYEYGE